MCLHLLQALLHHANRYCWKIRWLRQPPPCPCFLTCKDYIAKTVPIWGWSVIFHWMLGIFASAQSSYALYRIIRLISLKCTGLWTSNADVVFDSKARHKSGGWCFPRHETKTFLELVGWRLVSFDVNWGQGYMFRRVLWFPTKISIP